jgi:hypothetical protein
MYRYYVSQAVLKGSAEDTPAIARVPASEIEEAVVAQNRALLRQEEVVGTWWAVQQEGQGVTEGEVSAALERLELLRDKLFPSDQAQIVWLLVDRVDIGEASVDVRLRLDRLASLARDLKAGLGLKRGLQHDLPRKHADHSAAADLSQARHPQDHHHPRRSRRSAAAGHYSSQGRGVGLPADARTGRHATVKDLAAAEKINESYVSRVLRLTLLAPDIVEAILDGRQSEGVTLSALMAPFPLVWCEQHSLTAGATRTPVRLPVPSGPE